MRLETGDAVVLFAPTFLAEGRMRPLRLFTADRRSAVSLGAGMSAASRIGTRIKKRLNQMLDDEIAWTRSI